MASQSSRVASRGRDTRQRGGSAGATQDWQVWPALPRTCPQAASLQRPMLAAYVRSQNHRLLRLLLPLVAYLHVVSPSC